MECQWKGLFYEKCDDGRIGGIVRNYFSNKVQSMSKSRIHYLENVNITILSRDLSLILIIQTLDFRYGDFYLFKRILIMLKLR